MDQDAAFRWMCKLAGRGNFLVLCASGTDAYNPYIKKLCPAIRSIGTLIVTSREGAAEPFVAEKIRGAAALFISGGSQDNYIHFWQGTPVENGINAAIKTGVPVGGTSAGLAVMGDFSFAALKDTVKSSEALPNPFDEKARAGQKIFTREGCPMCHTPPPYLDLRRLIIVPLRCALCFSGIRRSI